MALSKDKKAEVVKEVAELLGSSKMTVVAKYQGTTVKELQTLRAKARENGTNVKVIKNRLVIKALSEVETLKAIETSSLNGMLLYAFNDNDEIAPAQSLNDFAKTAPTIEFVGAITPQGTFMGANDVKALATLPSKQQLIAEVVATLLSPVNDVMGGLSGNLHGLLDGIEAKAK